MGIAAIESTGFATIIWIDSIIVLDNYMISPSGTILSAANNRPIHDCVDRCLSVFIFARIDIDSRMRSVSFFVVFEFVVPFVYNGVVVFIYIFWIIAWYVCDREKCFHK